MDAKLDVLPAAASEPTRKPSRLLRPLANERGVALLLALAMLAIMTVIGVFALDTSTTEVQISGNYRTSQEAFFAADRAVQYGLTQSQFKCDPNSSIPAEKAKCLMNFPGNANSNLTATAIVAAGTGNSSLKSGSIECVAYGPDTGGGSDSNSEYGYYLINAVVAGPNGSEARVEVQSKVQFVKTGLFEL